MNSVSLVKSGSLPAKVLISSAVFCMLGMEFWSFFLTAFNSFVEGILENPPGISR